MFLIGRIQSYSFVREEKTNVKTVFFKGSKVNYFLFFRKKIKNQRLIFPISKADHISFFRKKIINLKTAFSEKNDFMSF